MGVKTKHSLFFGAWHLTQDILELLMLEVCDACKEKVEKLKVMVKEKKLESFKEELFDCSS